MAPQAFGDLADQHFSLTVNGELRQQGNTADMITPVLALLQYISTIFTLQPGDLIFSGTPAGVGPINKGDVLVGEVVGLPLLKTRII